MLHYGISFFQRSRLAALMIACAISLTACATAATAPASSPLIERVIVQFKTTPAAPAQAIAQLAQQYKLPMTFERELGAGFYVAQLKPAQSAATLQPILQQIALDPAVASIEADQLMHTMPVQ
ncbi:hypothetical protein [Deefgea rivuli]|uniref:hypothetical protein n=1 Tax=Deefgea rivuli TaxID=400948 RepID=UPI0004834EB3|nr:hypothetical protein [Deefgea rivuli]